MENPLRVRRVSAIPAQRKSQRSNGIRNIGMDSRPVLWQRDGGEVSVRIVVRAQTAQRARTLLDHLERARIESAAAVGPWGEIRYNCDLLLSDDPAAFALKTLSRETSTPPLGLLLAKAHRDGAEASGLECAPIDAPQTVLARIIDETWREAVAAREISLRRSTLQAMRRPLEPPAPPGAALRALYAGRPHAAYFDLEHGLSRLGVTLEASLTIPSAFDRLHDAAHDLLFINLEEAEDGGLALCGALRRNSRLDALPVAVIAPTPALQGAALAKGALEAGPLHSLCDASLSWLGAAARRRRRRAAAAQTLALGAAALAAAPGGLEHHLDALAREHQHSGRPFSLLLVELRGPEQAGATRRSQAPLDMVRGLARASDFAAWQSDGRIAALLPAASLGEAQALLRRCLGVLESTAFSELDGPLDIRGGAVELQPGESGGAMLVRAGEIIGSTPA